MYPTTTTATTSTTTSTTTTSSTTSTSTSTSSASPTPSGLCPSADGTTITEPDGSRWQIRCGNDLYDPNPNTRTVQTSLNACILACQSASISCTGVTWVESGQAEQYCYYKTPTAVFRAANTAAIQSAQRICYPRVPQCPGGNNNLYQGTDGSIFRLECNFDYPGSDVGSLALSTEQGCMETCDQRGATCTGISFVPSYFTSPAVGTPNYSCFIKSSMAPVVKRTQTYQVNSLVRLNTYSTLATGTEVVCTANNNAIYTTADGSQFQIVCNTDYQTTNLAVLSTSTLRACIDRCASFGAQCVGAAWTPAGNGVSADPTCYLKSTIGNVNPTTYVTHGFRRILAANYSTGQVCT